MVGTPIGNLEDITIRALAVLNNVQLIAAEDTRTTKKLLNRYKINTPVTSFHEHNKQKKSYVLMEKLIEQDIALVSDAGMPTISDPGQELILQAIEQGIPVIPIPGPSAVLTALVVSGLLTNGFLFVGFLPRKNARRKEILSNIVKQEKSIIIFEAPHRLIKTLNDLNDIFGNRKIAIGREMTKIHEEIFRGNLTDAIDHFIEPRGEFTLVIDGFKQYEIENVDEDPNLIRLAKIFRENGYSDKEAIPLLLQFIPVSRKKAYDTWIKSKNA